MIRHYLYFPSSNTAQDIAAQLRERGFSVEVRLGADDINWLVRVTNPESTDGETVEELLAAIAVSNSGEYDGWDADA